MKYSMVAVSMGGYMCRSVRAWECVVGHVQISQRRCQYGKSGEQSRSVIMLVAF